MARKLFRFVTIVLCFILPFEQSGFAQFAGQLDIPENLSAFQRSLAPDVFRPLHLRYLAYEPVHNSLNVLLDKGSSRIAVRRDLEASTRKLLDYFFIGLALPNDSFWVNLRPDGEGSIIDDDLARTDVGRILLESDLQLKKDVSRYTSPKTPEGREYWDKLYRKTEELFGSSPGIIPTLSRPWIVPDEVIVRETSGSAYIYKATLKIRLEQERLRDAGDPRMQELNEYSSQLLRQIVLPRLAREINSSRRYASLRQVYYSLVMAQWFKARFRGGEGRYSEAIDSKVLSGLTSRDPWSPQVYFAEYRKIFSEGEYDIRETIQKAGAQVVRTYSSGGAVLDLGAFPATGHVSAPGRDGGSVSSIPAFEGPVVDGMTVVGVEVLPSGIPGAWSSVGISPVVREGALTALKVQAVADKDGGEAETASQREQKGAEALVQAELTHDEIAARVAGSGTEEIKKAWKKIEEARIDVASLETEKIGLEKEYFLKRIRIHNIIGPVSSFFSYVLAPSYLITVFIGSPLSHILLWPLWVNTLLCVYIAVELITRKHNQVRLKDVANLLKIKDFRRWLDRHPISVEAVRTLRESGVNELWDNPLYTKVYRQQGGGIRENPGEEDHITLVQKALRYFVGYRDESGLHNGELTGSLLKGSRSGREILANYRDIIAMSKSGELTRDNSLYFLSELKNYIKPGSKGEEIVNDFIEAISKETYLLTGDVRVRIWQRDPWVDLSSHTEFNCCAFLGGVNEMGGMNYMYNKSISMLDFSTKKGRVMRAIMGAGTYMDGEGRTRSVLLVDSVEGTLSMDMQMVKDAIEDYAQACGFDTVMYNWRTYNAVPKKFLEHVENLGIPLTRMDITLADATSREYLEGFKTIPFRNAPRRLRSFINHFFPVMDYSYPRGLVEGYAVDPRTSVRSADAAEVDLSKVRIGIAAPSEWESIRDDIMEIETVFAESIRSSESTLEEIFQDPRSIVLTATYEGRVIGYAAGGPLEDYSGVDGVRRDDNYRENNSAYLFSIAVAPEFQGRAVGHDLRAAFLRSAHEQGYRFVTAHHKKGVAASRGDQVLEEFEDWSGTGDTYEYVRTDMGQPSLPRRLFTDGRISIEQVLPVHWEQIRERIMFIENSVFSEELRQSEEELRNSFTDPASVALIIRSGNEIVGYMVGGPLESYGYLIQRRFLGLGRAKDENLGARNTFYVESIAVLEGHRDLTTGIRLFQELMPVVEKRGYTYVTAHTYQEKIRALWEKMGGVMLFTDMARGGYYIRLPVKDRRRGFGTRHDPQAEAQRDGGSVRPGGIDFRSLPIVTQAFGNLPGFRPDSVAAIDPEREWDKIEKLVTAGVVPATERILKTIQADCSKGTVGRDVEKAVSCISNILRLEEEKCNPTDPLLKDILVTLDSAGSVEQLTEAFLGR